MSLFQDIAQETVEDKAVKSGVDANDARNRRQEVSVQIRKNKREESLRKRRQDDEEDSENAAASQDTVENAGSMGDIEITVNGIPRMIAAMSSSDPSTRVSGARAIRKLLSKKKDPPVKEVLEANALDVLFHALADHSNSKLQFEAAWALTNIGSSENTEMVANPHCLVVLTQLMQHADPQLREQSAWCIGNIAGHSPTLRDMCLITPNLVHGVVLNLEHPASLSMLRNVTWVASNLCRGNKPKPALNLIAPIIPVLARIIEQCTDEESVTDASWALSYVSDDTNQNNQRVNLVVQTGVCNALVNSLRRSDKCVAPILRTLGNIVTGDEYHTQAAIDAGLLGELVKIIKTNVKPSIRKEAAWAASNVTAGTPPQIAAVMATPGLLQALVDAALNDEFAVKKEAAYALCNILREKNAENTRILVDKLDVIKPMIDFLKCNEKAIVTLVLDALESVLEVDRNRYAMLIEDQGGLDVIENLQEHECDKIYKKAQELVSKYFFDGADDEESDQNVAPNVDFSGNFTFAPTPVVANKPFEPSPFQPGSSVEPHNDNSPYSAPVGGFNFSFGGQ